jgi:hypothetical protein
LFGPSARLGDCRDGDVLLEERDPRKIRYKRLEKLQALRGEIIAKKL